jgi:sarcosine oxidase
MGVATTRALAQAGRRVVLLEQFDVGHVRGSSHGASRIFRLTYPDPHYVRLAQGAQLAWSELEAEAGEIGRAHV